MSKKSSAVISRHETSEGSFSTYTKGFLLSIILTLTAYLLVTNNALSEYSLVAVVVVLALAQFLVQLLFFLHLGRETKPRWKLAVFAFMVMVVLILVFGSLWIMTNLNTRMTPEQMNNYMNSQDNL